MGMILAFLLGLLVVLFGVFGLMGFSLWCLNAAGAVS